MLKSGRVWQEETFEIEKSRGCQGSFFVFSICVFFWLSENLVLQIFVINGCLGYPGSSTVTNRSLDGITFPWLVIPTTQPCPPHSLPGTSHTELTVKRGRGGREGGGGAERRLRIDYKCAQNCSIPINPTKQYYDQNVQGPPRWSTL